MRTTRLRYWADVNPDTPEFSALTDEDAVGFMPLETVWADTRLDASRTRRKAEVQTGYVRFRRGDVLLPKVTPTFQAARTALVNDLPTAVGAGSTELHVLRARPDSDARMVAYATRTKHFVEEGVTAFQGVAGLQRVPERFVANFVVPDWPLEEQRRIADFLDDQVALLDRAIALRQQQKALLVDRHEAEVERTLRPKGTATPEVRARHMVAGLGVGIVIQPAALYSEDENAVLAVRGKDISPGRIAPPDALIRISREGHEENRRSELRPQDILVVRSGKAGAAAQVPDELVGGNCIDVVVVRPGDGMDPRYLEHSINCLRARENVLERAEGAIQKHFGVEDMKALPVVPRPLAEQRAVGAYLDRATADVERMSNLLTQSLLLLLERKQAMITAAVTGQFDVTTARSGA